MVTDLSKEWRHLTPGESYRLLHFDCCLTLLRATDNEDWWFSSTWEWRIVDLKDKQLLAQGFFEKRDFETIKKMAEQKLTEYGQGFLEW